MPTRKAEARSMRRPFAVAAALALGLGLSGCESLELPVDWFNTKKPLPGERRAVFPEGVPGVPQGVPAELQQGYQPPAPPRQAADAEPSPKPKPKPKPRQAAAPPSRPATQLTVQPDAPPPPPAQSSRPSAPPPAGQSPWPSSPPPPAAQSPWPAPRQTASQP